MSEKTTHYGFKYDDIQEAMVKFADHLIEDVDLMVDHLLMKVGAKFTFFDELPQDHPDYDRYGGKWTDDELHFRARIEIIRQLCGFLFQCLPPILEPPEPPFLLPHQLTQEYLEDWLKDVAEHGDHSYEEIDGLQEILDREDAQREQAEDSGNRRLEAIPAPQNIRAFYIQIVGD